MQENRSNHQIPESDLRKKLELRMKERGINKSFGLHTYQYNEDEEPESPLNSIFGIGACWVMCIVLGVFIFTNSLLSNTMSTAIVSRTETYLDGSVDIDNYWEPFRDWVNNLRRSGLQRMD